MAILPTIRVKPVSEPRKERLRRWLGEWEIEQNLRVGGHDLPPTAPAAADAIDVADTASEPLPAVGQIRLFVPRSDAERRPVYAAVLAEASSGRFVTAPYSRFGEPCLPGELLTSHTCACLSVLCLWNRAELTADALVRSWVVDAVSTEDLTNARALIDHLRGTGRAGDHVVARTGPPLWHPVDPRHSYLTEEEELVNACFFGGDSSSGMIVYPERKTAWPKAAEPGAKYGSEPSPEPPDSTDDQ